MKLTIINGSPRGKKSNTRIILDKFYKGFISVEGKTEYNEFYLKNEKDYSIPVRAMEDSDLTILAFPLYTDSMPGIVKEFIETISQGDFKNKKLRFGCIVQSGFPEAHHSEFISRYLEKLAKRMDVQYLGTAIRGGVEGLQIQSGWMVKYVELFYELGQHLALEWEFSDDILKALATPKHLKGSRLLITKILMKTGFSNYYWNIQLKQNKAYKNRFAKPYINI